MKIVSFDTSWIPCHRRTDRSFHIRGKKMPLCARCFSILIGYAVAPIVTVLHLHTPYYLIGLLLVPMLVDGYMQLWGWRKSNNTLRFLTGLSFGIGQSLFISNVVWMLIAHLST